MTKYRVEKFQVGNIMWGKAGGNFYFLFEEIRIQLESYEKSEFLIGDYYLLSKFPLPLF